MVALRLGGAAVVVIVLAISPPVAAQNAQVPSVAPVLAPKVLGEVTVPYPPDAQGTAEVILELVVDPEGNVSRAVVVEGVAPFSTAAERAAANWRFEPARRDGKAVAARIRFAVTFRDPSDFYDARGAETDVPVPSSATTSSPTTSTAPDPREISITVTGERVDHAATLSNTEIRELPGAFGDPFRAIEAMPGVTPIASGVPYFYVRGAPPGNVGYYFDGVRVPVLFHAALGPAVLAPWFVDDVKLYPGGYPARYGRFAGGIVAADAAAPKNVWRGMANVRTFDASAMVEAPFAEGRGNVMLGGRYSYSTAIASLVSPDYDLGYWDYQGRAHYDVTPDDRVSILAFGAFDFAEQQVENGPKLSLYDVRFHRFDARYDRQLSPTSHVRLAATLGEDRSVVNAGTGLGSTLPDVVEVRSKTIGARVEYANRLGKGTELRAGADVIFDQHDGTRLTPEYALELPPISPHDETMFGARADLVLDLDDVVSVVPGARFDVYRAEGTTLPVIEPRVSARFQVSPNVTLFHDIGLAHQLPSFVVPVPGFQPELGNGLQRSIQLSSGVKTKWPGSVTSTVTVFQNGLFNGTDRLSLAGFQQYVPGAPPVSLDARSLGRSFGVELQVKRDLTRRLGGFIAYTLARSVRSVGLAKGPAATDRTHVLNVALGYDLGRNWRAGLRAVFYTGIPARTAYIAAAASPPRTAPFYRFDWRLEKRWPFTDERYISLIFEFLNVTLNTEVTRASCSAFYCKESRVGPVAIPSIGVEAAF